MAWCSVKNTGIILRLPLLYIISRHAKALSYLICISILFMRIFVIITSNKTTVGEMNLLSFFIRVIVTNFVFISHFMAVFMHLLELLEYVNAY
jgi:hypothetical protein